MIIEYRRYELEPGEASTFERAWASAREPLTSSGHCEQYEVSRSLDVPGIYSIRIQWDSLSGLVSGFNNGSHYTRLQELVGPFDKRLTSKRHCAPVIATRRGGWDEALVSA